MTDSTGTTSRIYDALNSVTSKVTPSIGTTTFTYDITTNVGTGNTAESSTDPKGNTVTKEHDKMGRLVKVTNGSQVSSYEYYINGSLKKLTYPDRSGITTVWDGGSPCAPSAWASIGLTAKPKTSVTTNSYEKIFS